MNVLQRLLVHRRLQASGCGRESLMYRVELFRLLNERFPPPCFSSSRILEIGPKDGLDSLRLQSLKPSEIVFVELPEKTDAVVSWLGKITCPHRFVWGNLVYLTEQEMTDLGKFDLIYCTGVLYHNAEQLRLLRRLYRLAAPGGVLVLESATTRHPVLSRLPSLAAVEIHWPRTYRDSGTITHLPSRAAVMAWLDMVGWRETVALPCYRRFNPDLAGQRVALCARRVGAEDDGFVYYSKSGQNPPYRVGDA
jgi:SAM-dependent methyltransferase